MQRPAIIGPVFLSKSLQGPLQREREWSGLQWRTYKSWIVRDFTCPQKVISANPPTVCKGRYCLVQGTRHQNETCIKRVQISLLIPLGLLERWPRCKFYSILLHGTETLSYFFFAFPDASAERVNTQSSSLELAGETGGKVLEAKNTRTNTAVVLRRTMVLHLSEACRKYLEVAS